MGQLWGKIRPHWSILMALVAGVGLYVLPMACHPGLFFDGGQTFTVDRANRATQSFKKEVQYSESQALFLNVPNSTPAETCDCIQSLIFAEQHSLPPCKEKPLGQHIEVQVIDAHGPKSYLFEDGAEGISYAPGERQICLGSVKAERGSSIAVELTLKGDWKRLAPANPTISIISYGPGDLEGFLVFQFLAGLITLSAVGLWLVQILFCLVVRRR